MIFREHEMGDSRISRDSVPPSTGLDCKTHLLLHLFIYFGWIWLDP